jgi:subtilase family serine protease
MAATFIAGAATNSLAQPGSAPTISSPRSSVAKPGDAGVRAHTNIKILGADGMSGSPQVSGAPFPGLFFETPASLACIYRFQPVSDGCNPNVVSLNPTGGSKAIAIVDAYDDPNAGIDLEGFSAQFGLPTAKFHVVYAPAGGATPGSCLPGPAPRPPDAAVYGWDVEESLDTQWSHAMAPHATIYLVEAQTNFLSDLFCAVSVASALVKAAGGGQVAISWGGAEFPEETSLDAIFTTPKVVYFASAGDGPGVGYPSASPNVVSVGGTSLSRNPVTGQFLVENTWQSTGGGPSSFEPRPHYQDDLAATVGPSRGTPDVAADANPNSGVWVLDTLAFGPGTWYVVGGTSVATPVWAGITNAAGEFSQSSQGELWRLYSGHGPVGFFDITYGNCGPYNGSFTTRGWDFCSGLGSPRAGRDGDR